jgi:hypothetical protein
MVVEVHSRLIANGSVANGLNLMSMVDKKTKTKTKTKIKLAKESLQSGVISSASGLKYCQLNDADTAILLDANAKLCTNVCSNFQNWNLIQSSTKKIHGKEGKSFA